MVIENAPASLSVDEVGFTYPGQSEPALRSVSFEAHSGQVLFVLGPNGSGKTTLFKLLLKLLRPRDGTIALEGTELRRLGARALARQVSYIPQSQSSPFGYRVLDMVLMGRTAHLGGWWSTPSGDDADQAVAALAALGIESLSGRCINELSGGQQQLVLVARALCQRASVLIMDEPTASLDFGNQSLVLEEVRHQATSHGLAVLVSSHHPAQAFQYGDRVLLLRDGLVMGDGPVDTIDEKVLSALYGVPVRVARAEGIDHPLCVATPARRLPMESYCA